MNGSLIFEESDCTKTIGPAIIAHVTNNRRGWGKGFVNEIEKRFPGTRENWLDLQKYENQALGTIFVTQCYAGPEGWACCKFIAHLCAQDGYATRKHPCVLDYDALDSALAALEAFVRLERQRYGIDYVVHMPRIGCGLAGGNWELVEPLIIKNLVNKDINVVVHDWPPQRNGK